MKSIEHKITSILLMIGVSALLFSACSKVPPVITSLNFSRAFSPTGLSVRIRNKTTAEISWTNRPDVDSSILQFSKDSLKFDTIVATATVATDTLSVLLNGNTQYSVRLKAKVDSGMADSKWTSVAFKTQPEDIFLPLPGENIAATKATLLWPAGSAVTNFIINPGNIKRPITDSEKAAGQATITGLKGQTVYTVTIYNGTNPRGTISFKTLIDIGNATAVYPTDTLSSVIAKAKDGDVLALFPGDYKNDSAENIVLNKSVSIIAVYPYNKPLLHAQFELEDGATHVKISNIDMEGDDNLTSAFAYNSSGGTFGGLIIHGCVINNFDKSFVSDGGHAFSTDTISIDSCMVTNIMTNGGDFIDSRKSFIDNLIVKNTTFSNCATVNPRDFVRMDGGSKGNTYDDGTRTVHVTVTNCTMYNCMNSTSSTKRFFYVRWSQQSLISENNIFADMGISVYSNQSLTQQPTCSNDDYFNADGYYTANGTVLIDNSTNFMTVDPGFVAPDTNNFTVTNQTLIDNKVGPPQWLTSGK